MMKKRAFILLIILSLIFPFVNYIEAEGEQDDKLGKIVEKEGTKQPETSPFYEAKECTYTLGDKDYDFFLFKIDMNDKKNYVDLRMAKNKIGYLQKLKDIAIEAENEEDNSTVLAAINGGLFNPGRGLQPVTTIIEDGKPNYAYYMGAIANFGGDNKMTISRNDFEIIFSVNDHWEEPYGFKSSFTNQINYNPYGIGVLFDNYDGEVFDKEMIVVEVREKRVYKIHKKIPEKIEKNSYYIVSETNPSIKRIKVGDKIEYVYRAYQRDDKNKTDKITSLRTGVGSGPALVENGEIVLDMAKDNLKKLSVNEVTERSMIGMTKDKKLYLILAKNMDLKVLSKLALKLNMETALNLDGGSSSGLVVGNEYLFKPTRSIQNAVLIKRRNSETPRISINGKERFYETDPIFRENRTLFPLRFFLEDLDFVVRWDSEEQEIVFERYGETYRIKKGSDEIISKDKVYKMSLPIVIQNGRSFIYVRDIINITGGEVRWNGAERIVEVEIESSNQLYHDAKDFENRGEYDDAINGYKEVLKLDEDSIAAMTGIADSYRKNGEYEKAKKEYEKILNIEENHISSMIGLALISEEKDRRDEAIRYYKDLLSIDEENLFALKKMAKFSEEDKKDDEAIAYYKRAYKIHKEAEISIAMIKLYQKELDKKPKNRKMLKIVASLYEDLKDDYNAVEYYLKAYKLNSKDLETVKKLAYYCEKLYDYRNSIRYNYEAFKIKREDESFVALMRSYIKYKKYDDAIKTFETDSEGIYDPPLFYYAAKAYEKVGKKDKAYDNYKRYIGFKYLGLKLNYYLDKEATEYVVKIDAERKKAEELSSRPSEASGETLQENQDSSSRPSEASGETSQDENGESSQDESEDTSQNESEDTSQDEDNEDSIQIIDIED